jgi:hypothetical protein
MDSVKRARKIMTFLVIVPSSFCLFGIVAYFIKGKGDILGLLSAWTMC